MESSATSSAVHAHTISPHQADFFDIQKPFKALIGGRGSGKSWVGCRDFLDHCLTYAPPHGIAFLCGFQLTQAKFGAIHEFFAALRETERELGKRILVQHNKKDNFAVLQSPYTHNEFIVWFVSVKHHDDLRGASIFAAYLDEAIKYHEKVLPHILACLRDTSVIGGEKNLRLFLTTSWKHQGMWLKDALTKDERWEVVFARTADYHYLPRGYRQSLEENMSEEMAAEELDSNWDAVAKSGLILAPFRRELHVQPFTLGKDEPVIAGIDWGYNRPHVVFLAHRPPNYWVFDEIIPSQMSTQDLMHVIRFRRYKIAEFWVDVAGKQHQDTTGLTNVGILRSAFPDSSVKYITDKRLVQLEVGHNLMRALLRSADGNTRLFFSDSLAKTRGSGILTDMEQYRYAEVPGRDGLYTDKVSVASEAHKHSIDALRYPLLGLESRSGRMAVVSGGFS